MLNFLVKGKFDNETVREKGDPVQGDSLGNLRTTVGISETFFQSALNLGPGQHTLKIFFNVR